MQRKDSNERSTADRTTNQDDEDKLNASWLFNSKDKESAGN